jgi:hypothetical protein
MPSTNRNAQPRMMPRRGAVGEQGEVANMPNRRQPSPGSRWMFVFPSRRKAACAAHDEPIYSASTPKCEAEPVAGPPIPSLVMIEICAGLEINGCLPPEF